MPLIVSKIVSDHGVIVPAFVIGGAKGLCAGGGPLYLRDAVGSPLLSLKSLFPPNSKLALSCSNGILTVAFKFPHLSMSRFSDVHQIQCTTKHYTSDEMEEY